ncbi:MAG: hypothetical protein N2B06_08970 [Clostridium sp.]
MVGLASFGMIYILFLLGMMGLGIYTTLLFIKALKIYIDKNS